MNEVYVFASNPENLPQWAAGLSDSTIKKSSDERTTHSPMEEVRIRFVEKNPYGVIDHDVVLPSGEIVHNPLRVIKNSTGCDVVFTLFKLPHMTDETYLKDGELVENDHKRLKSIFEK